MHKEIIHKDDMITAALSGSSKISSIVKRTLGPGGLPIILERQGQSLDGTPLSPQITKDGVTVAEQCSSTDATEDLVIQSIKAICRKTNQIAGDGPQPLYSKILTPKGFVKMRDAKVGMDICGTDGTTQKILGVFPKGSLEIYKVVLYDGREVECSSNHLWEVTNSNNYGKKEIKSTYQLSQDFGKTNNDGNIRHKYYLPVTTTDFFEIKEEMPLDPYLVGVLLGDGSLSDSGSIELSLGIKKKHIIEKLKLPVGVTKTINFVEEKNAYRVKLKGIRPLITSLGLANTKSATKFIPGSYLYSSISTRKALLQGLLDTDGFVNKRGLFEYSTISDELANNFKTLVRSLGISIYYKKHTRKKDPDSYSNTPIHRIAELKGYTYGSKIVDVVKTGKSTEMQCIKVSNSNCLYITDDFIPTHNTTTAIVLGEAILQGALTALDRDASLNPQLLRESIEEASRLAVTLLEKDVTKVDDLKTIENVATISANGDTDIGTIIKQAFDAVGSEGVITVDEGHSTQTTIDVVNGFQISRGAEAQDRFFNNKEKTRFEAENAHILLYDGKLFNVTDLVCIFNVIAQQCQADGKKTMPPIVIVANDFSQEVIQFLLIQKAQGGLSVCAVKSPHMTTVRTAMLDDMAITLGGERFGNGNKNLQSATYDDLGICNRIVSTKYSTTFYDGLGVEKGVIERVDQLKAAKEEAESPYDASIISDRIAALSQGVAKIGVGGSTEIEIKERYHRIEDALNSARAAVEDGIIAGGGLALLRIARILRQESSLGAQILSEALSAPIEQIIVNVGETPNHVLTDTFLSDALTGKNQVYDARTKTVVDAFEMGIIDPFKVAKIALQNATSIAALLTTCGGGIIFSRKKFE